jgi:hypothetical protein
MKQATQFVAILLLATASAFPQALRPGGAPKGGVPKGGPKQPGMKKGGPDGPPPRLNAPNEELERLLAMSPEQRERVLEKLPAARQANIRKRFEQFDRLPPEERARRLEMWKRLESLPPEKRQLVISQMRAFQALPKDRMVVVRRALINLGKLSPEERESRLKNEDFRSRFSAPELQILSDLAENYPIPR